MELHFWNDILHKVIIRYKESAGNFSNEQLKEKLSQSFNLLLNLWISGSILNSESVHCKDFDLLIGLRNVITLTNLITSQKINESEEQKRNYFKP